MPWKQGEETLGLSDVRCLSIRQPWAWLIVNGLKNIENREWPTRFRGRFLIHASKGMTLAEYDACRLFIAGFTTLDLPRMVALERGGIIGEAVLLNCVRRHDSEWFCGPWGFVLGDAMPLPFEPLKGALGFFRYNSGHSKNDLRMTKDVGTLFKKEATASSGAELRRT